MTVNTMVVDNVESIVSKYADEYTVKTNEELIVVRVNLNKVTNEEALRQSLPTQDYPIQVRGYF